MERAELWTRAFRAGVVALAMVGLAGAARNHPGTLSEGALDAFARIAFWSGLWLAGARLAAWAVGSRLTGLAHLVWDGMAGLTLLVFVLLAVGLLPHGFHGTTVRVVLVLFAGTAVVRARLDPRPRFAERAALDPATRGFVLLLLAVAAAVFVWNRVPPVFFDARAYHFAQPELWLVEGRIAPVRWSLHSWFPPGMSVLYGAGLATGGEAWANDANLVLGVGLLGVVFDLGRRSCGTAAGLAACLVLSGLPLIAYALAVPAADLAHGAFACAALGALVQFRATGWPCWLERAALLGAGAALTKYLGLLAPVGLGALWLATQVRSPAGLHALRTRLRLVARFTAPALALLAPWLVANLIVTHNPVAPVGSAILATRGLAEGGAESFRADARGGLPNARDVRSLVPRWLTGDADESRIYPTPAFGFLPLVLVPGLIFALRDAPRTRPLVLLALALLALWLVTFRWERFLVAPAALLAVALGCGAVLTWRRGGVLTALPVLALLVGGLSAVRSTVEIVRFTGGFAVAAGSESPVELVKRSLPSARLYARADVLMDPEQDRVLLIGEMRHYGLSVSRAAPTGFNTHPLVEALQASPDPDACHRALLEQGFTHVIVDTGQVARSAPRYPSLAPFATDPQVLRRYVATLGAPLAIEEGVALYRIPG